jgi:hypothetical protein
VNCSTAGSHNGLSAQIAPVVTETERRSRDDESALPPITAASNGTAVGISDCCFESAAHQLDLGISLHDLTLNLPPHNPRQLLEDGRRRDGEMLNRKERSHPGGSDKAESISNGSSIVIQPQKIEQKKSWQGVRQKRRKPPPQPPWNADDFTLRAKLMLESILSEFGSSSDRSRDHSRVIVEDVLNSWLGKITRVKLTRLIKDLGFRGQPSLALEVFYWMQKQKGHLKPGAASCILRNHWNVRSCWHDKQSSGNLHF